MDGLKPLECLTSPDERHFSFSVLDLTSTTGLRHPTVGDLHEDMAQFELPRNAPDMVRLSFDVARNLWMYGWYYWPFHSASELHALNALDLALGVKLQLEDNLEFEPGRKPSLSKMLNDAIERRWIVDSGMAKERKMEGHSEKFPFPQEENDLPRPDDQVYTRRLADQLPRIRNVYAHPKSYWYTSRGSSYLLIEAVHDIIVQLFDPLTRDQGIVP